MNPPGERLYRDIALGQGRTASLPQTQRPCALITSLQRIGHYPAMCSLTAL